MGIKVPRASISVTIFDDPEFIDLIQTPDGQRAFALFVCLIAAAKVQNNQGRFKMKLEIVEKLIKWNSSCFQDALRILLEMPGRWVYVDSDQILVIRSFTKWHDGWGGPRDGAGRKKSSCNQDESRGIQDEFKKCSPVPVPVPVTSAGAEEPPHPPAGGEVSLASPSKAEKTPPASETIPAALDTPAFREAWEAYRQHRRERKSPLTQTAASRCLAKLAKMGLTEAVAQLNRAVENGWIGVFPNERKNPAPEPAPKIAPFRPPKFNEAELTDGARKKEIHAMVKQDLANGINPLARFEKEKEPCLITKAK